MVIGVTGVIGSGKSTIVNYIKELTNCIVLDTDSMAKELMQPGNIIYENVVSYFGKEILASDKTINREILSKIVFTDESKREALNKMTHGAVTKEVQRIIDENKDKLVVVESALLFDTVLKDMCDSKWSVITSYEEKKKRLMLNRGYSEEKVDRIIRTQRTNEEFEKMSDIVIKNDILEDAKEQVRKILKIF